MIFTNVFKAHPLLAQIPLIVSPFYNPPKAVTLPFSYKPLPSQLPETNVTKENLEAWISECKHAKEGVLNYGAREKQAYEEWHTNVVRRLAPGYLGGGSNILLQPQRRVQADTAHSSESPEPHPINQQKTDVENGGSNDIDRAFSTMNIR